MTGSATTDDLGGRGVAIRVAGIVAATAGLTLAVSVLEDLARITDASPVYLIAVVLAAETLGTRAAVLTSLGAFLVYDYLFTVPRFSLMVSDPAEWVSLLLFLLVAVVIGRLTSRLRERADIADRRVREGDALVAIGRDIAMATTFDHAAGAIAGRLRSDTEMDGVWISLAADPKTPVAVAGGIPPGAEDLTPWVLVRSTVDDTSDWLRVVMGREPAETAGVTRYDVPIGGDGGRAGAIHAVRSAGAPMPGRGARRILALTADQLGIALRRDELVAEVTGAEITRQSDTLRAAILDSVSHDLRTPIAGIRALAGGLLDPELEPGAADVRAAAASIDAEGARLGELVANLLDMGRIQAGAVRAQLEPYDLAELVEGTLRHHPAGDPGRAVEVGIDPSLPPVHADAVLLDVALGNVVDNAGRHAPGPAPIRVSAAADGPDWISLVVEDGGPGVPAETLPLLFDRFYRVPQDLEPSRHGLGMGLAIARGFVEAMGGTIDASASSLGGLCVRLRLRAAPPESEG
jgi:two-component system sensor histidine kinase KdpD